MSTAKPHDSQADSQLTTAAVAAQFHPARQDDLAPSGDVARARANLAALTTLRATKAGGRAASVEEQAVMARWSGWGALPAVFDRNAAAYAQFEPVRSQLRELLTNEEYAAAERSTINAHYTDAAYAKALWDTVTQLGFRGGRVLEPGCGSGNFIGFAPDSADVVGVELDPITASIAAALYPRSQIRNESFADSRIPESTFDLVVGNVPFGDVVLHDRQHNPSRHRIHNHFLIKSLHLTRPGGLMAVVTSRYTMDAANPAARRELAELADLVAAVRLPSGAHRRAAGTDVVTDVLVFRRRESGRAPAGATFEQSRPIKLDQDHEALRVNEYFITHPEHVLGELHVTRGDLGRPELGVNGERTAGPALVAALRDIAERARANGLVMGERAPTKAAPIARVGHSTTQPDGFLAARGGDAFTRVQDGQEVPYKTAATQASELRALLGLRDTVVELLQEEASSIDDSETLNRARERLNEQYERYSATYGPINRFSERRSGRIDPVTSEEKISRIRPRQGGFRTDPFANVVYALEHFDASTQTATKATIFRERVVARRAQRLGADTPEDALAICIDHLGEPRLEEIARLLGMDASEARAQLGTLVFDEPGSERLVPAAEYLSGNVRAKLAAATAAHAQTEQYAANITALAAVVPRDLGPDEIHAQLGAAWIHRKHVESFLAEILEDRSVRVEHPGGAMWVVTSSNSQSVQATSRWGTERYPATSIAQALLEQRQIRIYDVKSDGSRTFNQDQTLLAAEKATEMRVRFSEWIWEEPARAVQLARIYNDRFNAIVPRSYDGAELSLPGLAITFKPRPHQIAAVARIIHEPAVGLFHDVGAGKTAEMVMGAMELRRLGLASKPVVVVPNHMLEQFSREWLQMYPQAKLLAAAKEDLDRDNRRLFVAKCATGDWDAVVMTRSAFERIPMSPAAQQRYLEREIEAIATMLERAQGSNARFSIKRLEKMKYNAEERLKDKLDRAKDPGITFEQLGIDYIFADEAHAYKNLRTTSNIPGMAVDGSMRASDLHMKLEWLRERSSRVATLATATPIANSMGEVYTMQRLLRPDMLAQAGITDFDQWAATFGETTTSIEVAADGGGMRMQTRFAKFRNVPELLQQWQVSSDIKTAEDLALPVPALAVRTSDGQRAPETVVIAPSGTLELYMLELANRADQVRGRQVDPSVDNLLNISSDGRAAGLDLRLTGQLATQPQKVDVAAQRIAAIYEQHRTTIFPGADAEPHPRPGALQLVFSDLGTPKPEAWNVYDELRTQLIARGVPREAIRFVHDAKNDREKGELFAACRDGRVAVLIGSTEKMGVGTNVQLRAAALHHLDCPWRPADLAQREGRILRQGNANAEVQILRYVTERSFDAYLWQTVSRKAQFIAQVMRGRLDVREIEDIGDAALSYNEVKALAAGNPLLLEQAQVQGEVTRLERLQRAHSKKLDSLRWTIQSAAERAARLQQDVPAITHAMARLAAHKEAGALRVTVGEHVYTNHAEANVRLRDALANYAVNVARNPKLRPAKIGTAYGFDIAAAPDWNSRSVVLSLDGVPSTAMSLSPEDLRKASPLTRLDNRLNDLPKVRATALLEMERFEREGERARTELAKPFRHSEQLEALRSQLQQLDEQILGAASNNTIRLDSNVDPARASGSHESTSGREAGLHPRDKLVAGVEREFGRAAQQVPENEKIVGRMERIDVGADQQRRAVIVSPTAIYVVACAQSGLQQHVGKDVVLEKSAGCVRMTPVADPIIELGR